MVSKACLESSVLSTPVQRGWGCVAARVWPTCPSVLSTTPLTTAPRPPLLSTWRTVWWGFRARRTAHGCALYRCMYSGLVRETGEICDFGALCIDFGALCIDFGDFGALCVILVILEILCYKFVFGNNF